MQVQYMVDGITERKYDSIIAQRSRFKEERQSSELVTCSKCAKKVKKTTKGTWYTSNKNNNTHKPILLSQKAIEGAFGRNFLKRHHHATDRHVTLKRQHRTSAPGQPHRCTIHPTVYRPFL